MTVTAAADAPAVVANLAVAAESEGYGATVSLAITVGTPAPINVNGSYITGNAVPAAATIALYTAGAATPQTTTTSADGTFAFSNITPPYDLVATWNDPNDAARSAASAWVLVGLTRSDPVVSNQQDERLGDQQAILHITQTFPVTPVAMDTITVAITCPKALGLHSVSGDTAAFDVTVNGFLAAGDACTLDAIEWRPRSDNTLPQRYQIAHADITLSPSAIAVTQPISYVSYIGATHDINLSTTTYDPNTNIATTVGLIWNIAPRRALVLEYVFPAAAGQFPLIITQPPDSAGEIMTAWSRAPALVDTSCTPAVLGDSDLSIDVIRPPMILSPAQGATAQSSTVFAGTGGVSAVNNFTWFNNGVLSYDISVTTAASSMTFADLARYGLSVPASDG